MLPAEPFHLQRAQPVGHPDPPEQEALPEEESCEDVEHFRFRVAKNLVRRIDQYLTDRVAYLSRASIQRLIDDDLVTVNGRPVKASYHPRLGDIIEMVAPPRPVNQITPEPIPLDVLYEDEHLLALNKPAGLMVHPARGKWTGTLVNGLVHYGQKWSTVNGPWRPGILHRLDRNTTGVILVAKTDEAHWRLARQFERRTIEKVYLAVVHGIPPLLGDVIDMPVGKDRYVREKQAIRKVEYGGRPAVTRYEVLESFRCAAGACGADPEPEKKKDQAEEFSLLRCQPRTGRTHQIRVHLSARGFPVVGDTMYGGRLFRHGSFLLERQALHAAQITFVHPATLETMTIQAPLPKDFAELLAVLRSGKA